MPKFLTDHMNAKKLEVESKVLRNPDSQARYFAEKVKEVREKRMSRAKVESKMDEQRMPIIATKLRR